MKDQSSRGATAYDIQKETAFFYLDQRRGRGDLTAVYSYLIQRRQSQIPSWRSTVVEQ